MNQVNTTKTTYNYLIVLKLIVNKIKNLQLFNCVAMNHANASETTYNYLTVFTFQSILR